MTQEEASSTEGAGTAQKVVLAIFGLVLVLAATVAIVLTGSSSSKPAISTGGLAYPNADRANTRAVRGPIRADTVSRLGVAWSLPLQAQGETSAQSSTPTIADGIAYSQDSASNVQAIDLATGEVIWKKTYGYPVAGQNGVAVAKGRVYGATGADAFALDQKTGRELWSARLTRNDAEGIEMAPGYDDGIVYVSTTPIGVKGGEVGVLWALNARTGKKIWHFDTVPRGLWGNPGVNFGGGVTQAPAFDGRGGMYIGTGNPGPIAGTEQQPWGSSRPGPNPYTSSVVKLDAKTGKLRWHHQVSPHAICDWDMQGPPMLVESNGGKLVIAGGKAGIVVALDQRTGELVWKRPVGTHNGHDDDGIDAMRGDFSNLKVPMTVYPGALGGVAAPASTDGSTVFVPVVNHATTLNTQQLGNPTGPRTGEVVALDVATGAVKWKRPLSEAAFGATTVVNDLVFASSLAGDLYAIETDTGEIAWRFQLPTGMIAGLGVAGDTVLAPGGIEYNSAKPQLVAFRLP